VSFDSYIERLTALENYRFN